MEKKGMINRYTCENCDKSIVTIVLEDGTTPAFLQCQFGCGNEFKMVSSFYRTAQNIHPLEPFQYEWYRPKKKKVKKMSAWEQQHYEMGGLFLRRRFGIANMFRGNCDCGRWLMIPPNTKRGNPIECECGYKYFAVINGDDLSFDRFKDDNR